MMGGGMGKKSKPNDMWEAWRDIFRYIGRYKALFIITAALSALASGLALIGPYFISEMTDLIQVGIKGDMDIDAAPVQSRHQRGGYVRHAPRFRGKLVCNVSHAWRKVCDFRCHDQHLKFLLGIVIRHF